MRGSKRGERRGGRKKGTPNKLTADVKGMILEALSRVGGVDYLITQAIANPTAFMTLVGKILPTQFAGEDGAAIPVTRIEIVAADDNGKNRATAKTRSDIRSAKG